VVTGTVKKEKTNRTDKSRPVPRLIQARSPRFHIQLGRYIRQMEKEFYRAINDELGYTAVTKGLNSEDTARAVVAAMRSFDDPRAIDGDGMRFDQHVRELMLKYEHTFYPACFPPHERGWLEQLLRCQLETNGAVYCDDL